MKTLKTLTTSTLLITGMGASSIADAALVGRSLDADLSTIEAYYETEANITWLRDANYADTSGYDNNGSMTWDNANNWVANLNIDGITGWRLPNTIQPDPSCDYQSQTTGLSIGRYCTGSEMNNMFSNVLGNDGFLMNMGGFINLPPTWDSGYFWQALELSYDTDRAFSFEMIDGYQQTHSKSVGMYAWAVHDGDVGVASAVPVPAAVWLFGSGLIGLVGLARRKKA